MLHGATDSLRPLRVHLAPQGTGPDPKAAGRIFVLRRPGARDRHRLATATTRSVERVIRIDDPCHNRPFSIDVDDQRLETRQKQRHRKVKQAFELRLHRGGRFLDRPSSPTVQGQANYGDVPGVQQVVDRRGRSVDRQRNVVRRQKPPRLAGTVHILCRQAVAISLELILRPVDQRQRSVEGRSSSEAAVVQRGHGRSHLAANCRIEPEDKRRSPLGGRGGPDFGARRHFQDASESQTLVAYALVRVFRALAQLVEPLEVLPLERAPAVRDQEHRGRCGFQRKCDQPRIVTRRFRQGVMGVLQQLEYAPTAICLRDLPPETRDRPVLPRPVLELVDECAHLAQRMPDDRSVAAQPLLRPFRGHSLIPLPANRLSTCAWVDSGHVQATGRGSPRRLGEAVFESGAAESGAA